MYLFYLFCCFFLFLWCSWCYFVFLLLFFNNGFLELCVKIIFRFGVESLLEVYFLLFVVKVLNCFGRCWFNFFFCLLFYFINILCVLFFYYIYDFNLFINMSLFFVILIYIRDFWKSDKRFDDLFYVLFLIRLVI